MIPLALTVCFLVQDSAVEGLIRDLDADDITIRRKAGEELYRRGPAVEEALLVVALRTDSLEAALTAKELLNRMGKPISRSRRLWGLPTVDDSVRRFGKMKDDPPAVER